MINLTRQISGLAICIASIAMCAAAQTTPVTTQTSPGGTTNALPIFTGSYTVGDSAITQSNGKIGIGTAAPAQALDISSSGTGSANLQFDYTPQPTVYFHDILNTFSSTGGTMKFTMRDNAATTTPLTLTSGGYVGIGTTAPAYTLDVAGTIRSSSGGIVFPDGSVLTSASGLGSGSSLISQWNGKVGIGTTAPVFTLDVAGAIRSSTGGIVFPDGTTQTTAFSPALSGSNVITQWNGKVGIGTSSPTAELDIEGTAPTINVGAGGAYEYNGQTMYVANTGLYNYFLADPGEVISPATTGTYNLGAGLNSLTNLTTGYENTSFGNWSLIYNTLGFHNAAFGFEALQNNTTGNSNTAVGEGALWKHVTGNSNTSVGLDSMRTDIGSAADTAIGQDALFSNTISAYDTSVGHQSMYDNTTGSENSAFGERALYLNTTGAFNTAAGYLAGNPSISTTTGYGNTTGNYNTYVGAVSGPNTSATPFSYQTDIGAGTTGSCSNCVVLGRTSDTALIPGKLGIGTTAPAFPLDVAGKIRSSTGGIVFPDGTTQSTAFTPVPPGNNVITQINGKVGIGTTNPTAELDVQGTAPTINVAAGGAYQYNGQTMYVANPALYNYFFADQGQVISPSTTGTHNVGAGLRTLSSLTTGYENVSFGNWSSIYTTTGFHNAAFGFEALENNTTGNSNTAVGEGALWKHVTGNSNTSVGLDSMVTDTGSSADTAIGQDALYSNTTSAYDTSVGHQSMYDNTTGSENSGLGERALYLNTTGTYNTAAGYLAGNPSISTTNGYGNTTGNYNTYLGAVSGPSTSSTPFNYQTDVGAGTTGSCSNCVVLGRASDSALVPGKLGIGTATPAYTLDVAGAIRSSSGGIVFPDGSIQTTAFKQVVSGSDLIDHANGAFGIGTSNPDVALSVYPHAGQSAAIFYTDDSGRGIQVGTSDYEFGGSRGTVMNIGMVAGTGETTGSIQVQSDGKSENLTIEPNGGNVGIGTTTPGAALEVNGNVKLTGGSGSSIIFPDGTVQSTAYTRVTLGGDYAESVEVSGDRMRYTPGDLLVIDPGAPGKFLKSDVAYSTMVAGIYSTNPGTIGRRLTTAENPDEIPMALEGIVPLKVSAENGPIKIGDRLVSSSTPGMAMKATDRNRSWGAVIGKALGSLDSGTGVVEVLVTLQ